MARKHWVWLAALGLAGCSLPFSYTVNVLDHLEAEGTFQVRAGGLDPNPKRLEPVEITYTPDRRVQISGATLEFKVCFSSETPGASFQGTLGYAAYLSGNSESVFDPANQVVAGSGDVGPLRTGEVCVEGQKALNPGQLQALRSGSFFVGAEVYGDAQSDREATVRYRAQVFRIRLSGSAGM